MLIKWLFYIPIDTCAMEWRNILPSGGFLPIGFASKSVVCSVLYVPFDGFVMYYGVFSVCRENMPSHFKVKEYCPLVFRNIRERFSISDDEFMVSTGPCKLSCL